MTKPKTSSQEGKIKLTPEERKKLKNKMKRKKQQAKKAAMKRKSGDNEAEFGQVGSKKPKKFYDPDSNHNKRSAAQIERFKKKFRNPGKKFSKATPDQIEKYKKEYKAKVARAKLSAENV